MLDRDIHHEGNRWKLWRTIGWTLLICLFPMLSWADTDTRPATKQEKEFYRQVMTTIEKALPTAPKGWDTLNRSEVKELQRVAAGLKDSPFFISYHVNWQDTKRKKTADDKMQKAVDQQSSAGKFDNSKLMAQYEKLAEHLGKAAEAGDMKKVEKLQAEMEKIAAKMNGDFQADDNERNKLMESMAPHDVNASITVNVNAFYRDFLGLPKKEAPLGTFPVYWTEGRFTPERGWEEGYTFVFIGKGWRYQRNGEYAEMCAIPRKGISGTSTQAIEVIIQADPQHAKQLMNLIDWESLSKLVKS